VLSVLTAQALSSPPTLTEVKVPPPNGEEGPQQLQHGTVPSVFTPHAVYAPTLTDAKVPSGGANPGQSAGWASLVMQAMEPSDFTPHMPGTPTLNDVKGPAGSSLGLPFPQQATVPSIFTPHPNFATLTEVNLPAGGGDEAKELSPQQTMAPSVLTAHAELARLLTLTVMKVP
jgi:hypothetical protein